MAEPPDALMLGMESQHTPIVEMLQSLRTRYAHMMRAAGTADTMTTGMKRLWGYF